jgi:TonB-linked SusC/RagA family outer membrane protein
MKYITIITCLIVLTVNLHAQDTKDTSKLSPRQLKEVSVISNGYQRLSKGKITGSFVQLDSAILNRRVSPDILSRLDGITPGLIFNRGRGSIANDISIRGRSTLFADDQPLFVLDNFPYEGDLAAINPNDVESITVLKDAAAAAIWGARSGNGVIVITTRSGNYNQKTRVVFNTNCTFGGRPNQFYIPEMSSGDFIDMEKKLFQDGFYSSKELSGSHEALSPVVELLIAKRDRKIDAATADEQIEKLKMQDVRNDYKKYLYQPTLLQQYALQLSGGADAHKYLFSAGYDKGRANLIGNHNERITLRGNSTHSFAAGKGEFGTEVYYIQSRSQNNNSGESRFTLGAGRIYPYARLVDDNGTPVSITHDYRQSYVDAALSKGLLDWSYNPLREIELSDQHTDQSDLRLNSRLKYAIFPGFAVEGLYQYTKSDITAKNLQVQDSYFTRNLINQYTQVNSDGSFNRIIPLGAIQDQTIGFIRGNSVRTQLNYNRNLKRFHELNVLLGYELRSQEAMSSLSRLYGFDPENGTNRPVDYIGTYPSYVSATAASLRIPFQDKETAFSDRYISWYGNGAYTFKHRYNLTGSARLDRSNIFGVRTNQKGVPLYSAGLSWNLAEESFYKWSLLTQLKVRTTFGYNGNVDRSLSALTTAVFYSALSTQTNLPFASINNPPNPDLRWERVKVLNAGLDFGFKNQRVYGSIDVYQKKGIDLIGNTTMPGSSGVSIFRGNTASSRGKGIDIILNTLNVNAAVKWSTSLLFSHVSEKVLKYDIKALASSYVESGAVGVYPYEGRPLGGIYSYPWAGLDPANGDPRGYLNGVVSKDYNKIMAETSAEELVYHGPSRPPVFGALRNQIDYKNFSFAVNFTYRLGYYFRRSSVFYNTVLNGQGGHADYSDRWQKSGDEVHTQVPSLPVAKNLNRDRLYTYSTALVEKGDHIRLQDINVGYSLHRKDLPHLPFSKLQIYAYASNLGLIWKASKLELDPDYPIQKLPAMLSIGLKVDFK